MQSDITTDADARFRPAMEDLKLLGIEPAHYTIATGKPITVNVWGGAAAARLLEAAGHTVKWYEPTREFGHDFSFFRCSAYGLTIIGGDYARNVPA